MATYIIRGSFLVLEELASCFLDSTVAFLLKSEEFYLDIKVIPLEVFLL